MLAHPRTRTDRSPRGSTGGFTLIEILVVIVILGILAAVVVLAVGGIDDKGETSACKTQARTIRTAQEAKRSQDGEYAPDLDDLAPDYISSEPDADLVIAGVGMTTSTLDLDWGPECASLSGIGNP